MEVYIIVGELVGESRSRVFAVTKNLDLAENYFASLKNAEVLKESGMRDFYLVHTNLEGIESIMEDRDFVWEVQVMMENRKDGLTYIVTVLGIVPTISYKSGMIDRGSDEFYIHILAKDAERAESLAAALLEEWMEERQIHEGRITRE